MAPHPFEAAALLPRAAEQMNELARRDLSVNKTQAVTLGIILAYAVVIGLLWNIPYVRNVLWPFKNQSVYDFAPQTLHLVFGRDAQWSHKLILSRLPEPSGVHE